jgi:hypothetical protein
VLAVNYPVALAPQYVAMAGTLIAGLYAISRGLIIEAPATLTNAIEAGSEWFTRRAGAIARPLQ